MIGNDIIDLKLAKKESNYWQAGFLEKQFSSNEQTLIKSTSNTFLLVLVHETLIRFDKMCSNQFSRRKYPYVPFSQEGLL